MVVYINDGTVAQRLRYDAFGNATTNSNPGFQSFGFVGGLYDEDTKLVKFGARDYDSETGRWTAKEPLGFAGSNNFYSYCENDPLNRIDPSGLISSLRAFLHYLNKSGDPIYMPVDEIGIDNLKLTDFPDFNYIATFYKDLPCDEYKINSTFSYQTTGEQAFFLGRITLKLKGSLFINKQTGQYIFSGKLRALPDIYNFNRSTHRSIFAEFLTTIGRSIEGKPYEIIFTGARNYSHTGFIVNKR